MHNLQAFAVRFGDFISVSVSGLLSSSLAKAWIDDKYPGGDIVYLVDPGQAQVFIVETTKKFPAIGLPMLVPWYETCLIPYDKRHKKVSIYVNGKQTKTVDIIGHGQDIVPLLHEGASVFIVIGVEHPVNGAPILCSVFPDGLEIPEPFQKFFGPDTLEKCVEWITHNAAFDTPPPLELPV